MNPSSRRSFLRRLAALTAAATSSGVGPGACDRHFGVARAESLPGSPTLATIKQRQRLRVAVIVGSAPFASVGADAAEMRALIAADPPPLHAATGGRNVVGLDADLAAAVAQVLGVPLELIPVDRFEATLLPLSRGEVELALGGISRTAARATVLAFSMPYLTAGQEVFALEERRFLSLHDVNQPAVKVGVRAGSFAQAYARRDLGRTTPVVFASAAELFGALTRRTIDVGIAEGPVGRDFALRRGITLFAVEKRRVTTEAIAMATRQGDGDFVEFLSLFIRELRQSGDFMRLAHRYNQWLRVDR